MDIPKKEDHLLNISYDSVIFGFSGDALKILLLEYHDTGFFALPGGFVRKNENLNDAVIRGVKERTGLEKLFLEQFHTFGNTSRSDAAAMKTIIKANHDSYTEDSWLFDRFISVGYYALIDYAKVSPTPDALSDSIDWYAIDDIPPLLFEHNLIIEKAIETLRNNLNKKLMGINLLPDKFTMKALQQVHEAILDEKLGRTAFQRKMLSLDLLERHEKQFSGKAHKAPYLYSFKSDKA
ncbi:MAG: NUDIX hydrolase [Flavobacteriaceae bacterium]|nr:MAG: NUDIX hydrolase [Flavobacteriaceae bacterium]